MNRITTMAVILNLGIAGLYAQGTQVRMTFSGTEGTSAIDLQYPDPHSHLKSNSEFNFGGNGSLGSFTFQNVEAESDLQFPQQSSACAANEAYYPTLAGGGVFRFRDGSLLTVKLTEGHDCIDFQSLVAHCTRIFEITGGTNRFKGASGELKLTEAVKPAVFDAAGLPAFFAAKGKFTGMVSGVAREGEERGEDEQE